MANVYIEPEALESWKVKMSEINESCIEHINSFKNTIDSMSDCWDGSSSEAYIENVDVFMENVLTSHDKMKNVDNFLEVVVQTMESQ